MLVRVFQFRVKKGQDRAMRAFMRRKALGLLKKVPGCMCAYFVRGEAKGEYMWVTVWKSDAARKRAVSRPDWIRLVWEETERFFAGKPKVQHYEVLAAK